jgi:LysR family glycine cleavage system transcriptional activator
VFYVAPFLPAQCHRRIFKTARHLNLTHAAKELCLTQGAVSRKLPHLRPGLAFHFLNATPAGCGFPQGSALLPELQSALSIC